MESQNFRLSPLVRRQMCLCTLQNDFSARQNGDFEAKAGYGVIFSKNTQKPPEKEVVEVGYSVCQLASTAAGRV